MKTASLVLALISAALFVYCVYTIDVKDDKLVGHLLQTSVFAINSIVFFAYWRRVSKQGK